ncbi:uncharacterized protein K460DRAFT_352398 [Cucurbitaria berberidis CBS 394.84]|uniref:CorA-like transporter domain-containing protein n=1 Tax=Cucurbitaria berberidis CBS 394.84 TaxID=1168544 RepID=A0A9P4GKC7_9PLEO|nr:uncharacterized protein K460DRAFT_352398 [Cucurbitaria berberidis CBS 394.84]KAF1847232.1 hypothetical protein K460DRAFT_352398 [Cucurbitaria berberidis CBS 394.84]
MSGLDDLKTIWKETLHKAESSVIIINRKNSWSRMKILPEMFKYLCFTLEIHPRFLDIAFGFCRRTATYDQTFTCYHMTPPIRTCPVNICYNIRFFEPNGCPDRDSWSCRQSAVHHRVFPDESHSVWTIIQSPTLFRASLEGQHLASENHPLALHARYIRSCIYYWRQYLNEKDSSLVTLVELGFSTIQDILFIRDKMHHVLTILDGTLNVLKLISSSAITLGDMTNISCSICMNIGAEFDQISADLESHRLAAKRILAISKDLILVNQNVLNIRNQEYLIQSSHLQTQLGEAAASENRILSSISESMGKDSRTMKIATVVAMFYLPANLVMAFFSTEFVKFETTSNVKARTVGVSMTIHSQVWIAFVATFVLAVFTVLLLFVWNRSATKSKISSQKING